MDPVTGAAISAAAMAAGAYLNAKFSIGTDLRQLRYDREWSKRLGRRIADLGDSGSLFGMFDLVDEDIEALWFEEKSWTYGEIKNDVHRLATFLGSEGIEKGNIVAVFMTNSPEMLITILALSKLGAVSGLININLRDATLKHCLDISAARLTISTADLSSFISGSTAHFSLNLGSFTSLLPGCTSTHISSSTLPTHAPHTPAIKTTLAEVVALIFTSGTTGKPKACAIRNHQILVTSNPLTQDVDSPSTYFPLRTYSPLPLFHATALFTLVSYSIGTSSTMCLARKFSSSRFWKDAHDSRATRILYVGELCRYLVNSPPSPYDQVHNCIVAAGNGLRGEIWNKFKTRFNIPEIREFYRSTEGVAKYDNFGRGVWGSRKIGFAGPLRQYLETDTQIVVLDPGTSLPYRSPITGFCVRAKLGEAGEVIGRVKSRELLTEYLGNQDATEEKLVRDVFVEGDIWQKMGDLLVMEKDGWVKFHDRMGDTFRWKGENVSEGEVRDHLAQLKEVTDAVVWGVKLANYDGQAGAAALTLGPDCMYDAFMGGLYKRLTTTGLPNYALPRLVRITKEIAANATFKKSKVDMAKKSWIPSSDEGQKNIDKLYWLEGKSYKPLDRESWRAIEIGKTKL